MRRRRAAVGMQHRMSDLPVNEVGGTLEPEDVKERLKIRVRVSRKADDDLTWIPSLYGEDLMRLALPVARSARQKAQKARY